MSRLYIKNRYATIPNHILNDNRLSWKAKGLWAYIQSKYDGWDFSIDRICKDSEDGEKATRSGIQELEDAGYLVRTQIVDGTKFAGFDYELLENPSLELRNPSAQNRRTENGGTATSGEKTDSYIYSKKELVSENLSENYFSSFKEKKLKSDAKRELKKSLGRAPKPWELEKAVTITAKPPSKYPTEESVTEADFKEIAKEMNIYEDDVESSWIKLTAKIRAGHYKAWGDYKQQLRSFIAGGIKEGYIEKKKTLEERIIEQYGKILE
jgi:hypothetical protein